MDRSDPKGSLPARLNTVFHVFRIRYDSTTLASALRKEILGEVKEKSKAQEGWPYTPLVLEELDEVQVGEGGGSVGPGPVPAAAVGVAAPQGVRAAQRNNLLVVEPAQVSRHGKLARLGKGIFPSFGFRSHQTLEQPHGPLGSEGQTLILWAGPQQLLRCCKAGKLAIWCLILRRGSGWTCTGQVTHAPSLPYWVTDTLKPR